MNATFTVPVGMPENVTITLTPKELLALTAALDQADEAVLRDNGVRDEVIEVTGRVYNELDTVTSMIFGDDWYRFTDVDGDEGWMDSDDGGALSDEDLRQ
jgi:hypothetical protein